MLGCELRWAEAGAALGGDPSARAGQEPGGPAGLRCRSSAGSRSPWRPCGRSRRTSARRSALYGLICGPFTLALHLLGNNIFLDMFDKPEYVKAVVSYCASVGMKAAQAYLDNGADVIAVVDPMTSQISPEHFREFCSGPMNHIFDFVREPRACSRRCSSAATPRATSR